MCDLNLILNIPIFSNPKLSKNKNKNIAYIYNLYYKMVYTINYRL